MATKRKKKAAKRDPSGGNLGVPVLLRAANEAELKTWTEAAERAGVPRNTWIRQAANEKAAR